MFSLLPRPAVRLVVRSGLALASVAGGDHGDHRPWRPAIAPSRGPDHQARGPRGAVPRRPRKPSGTTQGMR